MQLYLYKNPDFQSNKPQIVCCKNIKHMPTDDKTGCRLCSCSLSTVSRRRGVETRPNRFAISSLACRTTRCLLCDGPHHPWLWGGPSAQVLMASSKMKDCRRRMAESISDLWKTVIEGLNDCNVTINSSQISSTIGILGWNPKFWVKRSGAGVGEWQNCEHCCIIQALSMACYRTSTRTITTEALIWWCGAAQCPSNHESWDNMKDMISRSQNRSCGTRRLSKPVRCLYLLRMICLWMIEPKITSNFVSFRLDCVSPLMLAFYRLCVHRYAVVFRI